MPDNRASLLPVYMVADESGSMRDYIGELNAGLASLHATLFNEPMVAAKVRLSLLGFAEDVAVRLSQADLRDSLRLPMLVARGATNFGAVFNDLLTRIPADVHALKAQNFIVHRPVMFFLTDGTPSDGNGWKKPYAKLINRAETPAGPNIVAFGIGQANSATISAVATHPQYAFVAIPGANVGAAIASFCTAFTQSVVESGRTMSGGASELIISRPDSFVLVNDVL
jgi:uncharacterized protein YegL